MQHLLGKLDSALAGLEKIVALFLLTGILFAVSSDVVMRELGYGGVRGASRLATLGMIMMAFVGVSLVARANTHLRMSVFDRNWGRYETLHIRLKNLIAAAICIAFAYFGALYSYDSFIFKDRTVYLEVPLWIFHGAIPYAFAAMAFRHLIRAAYPPHETPSEEQV